MVSWSFSYNIIILAALKKIQSGPDLYYWALTGMTIYILFVLLWILPQVIAVISISGSNFYSKACIMAYIILLMSVVYALII